MALVWRCVLGGLAVWCGMVACAAHGADVVVFAEQGAPVRFAVANGTWTRKGPWLAPGETDAQPVCGVFAGGTVFVAERLASGAESDGRIVRYAPDGRRLGVFKDALGFFPSCLAVSPDGVWLYAACAFDRQANTLWRWRLADGAGGACTPPEFETVRAMAFGADGLLYASCRTMSAVRVFETNGRVMLKGTILSRGAATGGLVMDVAHDRLFLAGHRLEWFDLKTGARRHVASLSGVNALGGGCVASRLYVTDRASGTIREIGPDGLSKPVATVPQAMGFTVLAPPPPARQHVPPYRYADLFRSPEGDFRPMPYNNPSARPFLKGGLCTWVTPLNRTGRDRTDLILQSWCMTPWAGTFLAENVSGTGGATVFRAPRRLCSYGLGGLSCFEKDGRQYFTCASGLTTTFPTDRYPDLVPWRDLPWNIHWNAIGRNVWRLADLDGDDRLDLLVGVSDTREYGWGDFYEPRGNYRNARPHGYLWWIRNEGTGSGLPDGNGAERWAEPALLRLENKFPVEALGHVFPMPFDWDGDGDQDILCTDASGTVSYFENVGTKTRPVWTGETFPRAADGRRLDTYLNQTTAAAVDFDRDGHMDVMLAEEDGRVAFMRGTGRLDPRRAPVFEQPVYLRQEAADLNYSSLATPCAVDWDADGDIDLLAGEAGGAIAFIENLSGPGVAEPSWAEPKPLSCDPPPDNPFSADRTQPLDFQTFQHDPIRIQAGSNGSMLGPVEAKYGYTVLSVADWDGDGRQDVMAGSIWGKPLLFRNVGTSSRPRLAAPTGVPVAWPDGKQPPVPWGWFHPDKTRQPGEVITQWRTTPYMTDLNGDTLVDLVMLDHEGFFAFFERTRQADGALVLKAPVRAICDEKGAPLNLTYGRLGAGGRRKFCFCDWDRDGVTDMLVNGVNVDFFKGLGRDADGKWRFRNEGPMGLLRLAGHTTSPTTADFDGDGIPELVVGAEDGFFYRLDNVRASPRPRRFTVAKDADGRAWFVTPDGRRTFLRGVDHVRHMGWYCEKTKRKAYEEKVLAKYGTRAAWETNTLARLTAWGFNAFGVGCDASLRHRGLWHTEILHLGDGFTWSGKPDHAICPNPKGIPSTAFPNVFSPDFEPWCRARARKMCAPFAQDESLVGYFLDNELCWWGVRGEPAEGMFETVSQLPPAHTARQALERFVAARGGRVDGAMKRAFLEYVAETYFRIASTAVRTADPGRLVLGCRFANLDGAADACVWAAAGRWCDVVSFNCYAWADLDRQAVFFNSFAHAPRIREMMDAFQAVARKPFMVTEWSFPALDSGLPCRNGAGQRFQTQAERAVATDLFARTLLACPYMAGYHYFMWLDQPAEGISAAFPEDANYGLVNGNDEPYAAVTAALRTCQAQAETLHTQPPPPERPLPPRRDILADDARAELRRAAVASAGRVAYRRDGARYVVSDGQGLVCEGTVGGAKTFERVTKNGTLLGTFGVMVCRRGGDYWENARRVTDVRWEAEGQAGTLAVTEEGGQGAVRWRVRTAYTFVPGTGKMVCELRDIQNVGTEPMETVSFFFRQTPEFPLVGTGRQYVPGEWLWKGRCRAGWRGTDGQWYGASTQAPFVKKFYYFTVDGHPLPDAEFRVSGQFAPVVLAPGASVFANGRVWMLAE